MRGPFKCLSRSSPKSQSHYTIVGTGHLLTGWMDEHLRESRSLNRIYGNGEWLGNGGWEAERLGADSDQARLHAKTQEQWNHRANTERGHGKQRG